MTDTAILGPAEAVDAADAIPFVRNVKRYAEEVLRPTALQTDRQGVTAARLGELRELGLLNHLAPAEYGGQPDIDRAADRRLHEILSGACLNTWLVWAQHAPLVGRLAATGSDPARPTDLGRRVLAGELLLGAAISDTRRFPERYIAARREAGGWTFTGTVSWVSGWGLNSVLTVAAVEPETRTVVTALVPVGERTRGTPLDLAAVGGSRTERVVLDDVVVPDEQVLSTTPVDRWRTDDLGTAGDARAHHFGLAATVLRELAAERHPLAGEVAAAWAPRVARIRADAYRLADETAAAGSGDHRITERLAVKVASGEALTTLTRALLLARSGHGLGADDTAQLHARSALFLLVQGQNDEVRQAQLAAIAHSADEH